MESYWGPYLGNLEAEARQRVTEKVQLKWLLLSLRDSRSWHS